MKMNGKAGGWMAAFATTLVPHSSAAQADPSLLGALDAPLVWETPDAGGPQPLGTGLVIAPPPGITDAFFALSRRTDALMSSNGDALARVAQPCTATIDAAPTLDLPYSVAPRFPMPQSRDPADAVMRNDLAYARNDNLLETCSIAAQCSEAGMHLAVSFDPVSNLDADGSLIRELLNSGAAEQGNGNLAEGAAVGQLPSGVELGGSVPSLPEGTLLELAGLSRTTDYTMVVEDPLGRSGGRMMSRTVPDGLGAPTLAGDSFDLYLPQGTSRATLRAENNGQCIQATFDISVDDIVVAVLGDSYASGEGTPIDRYDPSLSGSDMSPADQRDLLSELLYNGAGASAWARGSAGERVPLEQLSADLPNILGGGTATRSVVNIDRLSEQTRSHHLAHRSPFVASARAAMRLEGASDQTSVTYVNFAVSGATIDKGIRRPSSYPEERGQATQTQIDQLGAALVGRHIDHLLLGFGGNDTGFAKVAKQLVTREGSTAGLPLVKGKKLSTIKRRIWDGKWSETVSDENDIVGMRNILREYAFLAEQIERLKNDYFISIGSVYLLGYPDPMRLPGRTCEFLRDVADRNEPKANIVEEPQQIFDLGAGLEVSSNEARWARNEFLRPLGQRMRCAAKSNGWTYIEMPGDAFARNGICGAEPRYDFRSVGGYNPSLDDRPDAAVRWFRAGEEAFTIQSASTGAFADGSGVLHPNEHGYQAMSIFIEAAFQGIVPAPSCDLPPTPEEPLVTDERVCLEDELFCPQKPN